MTENLFLFPTIVQITKYEELISPQIYQYINDEKNYEFQPGVGMFMSKNSEILDLPMFENLKNFLEKAVNNYIKEMKIKNVDAYITMSWLNMHHKGESHPWHSHANSILSGVFYFDDSTPISFMRDEYFVYNKAYKFEITENNSMNSHTCDVDTKKNTVVIFPSRTIHGVSTNNTSKNRISLAFNTYIHGKLGMKEALTQLILK